jgi:hypothetical protein
MAGPADKFYLHITAVPQKFCLERRPFGSLTFVDLPPLIGDRSGHGYVEITRRYFRNQPLFVIAADDNFSNKDWPVTAVINDHWFRGALVVLAERSRDPAARPLQGDTFLDGLTVDECDEAIRWISGPPGRPLNWPVPRNRVRF